MTEKQISKPDKYDDMKDSKKKIILRTYEILFKKYGPQGWWPLTPKGSTESKHHQGRPKTERDRFEVMIGAILTQNTAWKNVEKALSELNKEKLIDPKRMARTDKDVLAELIRSAGYYNQKAERLIMLAQRFKDILRMGREELLSLKGIGPETADSILLYALEKPSFVVDAYTKRIFSRIGLFPKDSSYEEVKTLFENALSEKNHKTELFKEYHALIVEHAKRSCKTRPECENCVLRSICLKEI